MQNALTTTQQLTYEQRLDAESAQRYSIAVLVDVVAVVVNRIFAGEPTMLAGLCVLIFSLWVSFGVVEQLRIAVKERDWRIGASATLGSSVWLWIFAWAGSFAGWWHLTENQEFSDAMVVLLLAVSAIGAGSTVAKQRRRLLPRATTVLGCHTDHKPIESRTRNLS